MEKIILTHTRGAQKVYCTPTLVNHYSTLKTNTRSVDRLQSSSSFTSFVYKIVNWICRKSTSLNYTTLSLPSRTLMLTSASGSVVQCLVVGILEHVLQLDLSPHTVRVWLQQLSSSRVQREVMNFNWTRAPPTRALVIFTWPIVVTWFLMKRKEGPSTYYLQLASWSVIAFSVADRLYSDPLQSKGRRDVREDAERPRERYKGSQSKWGMMIENLIIQPSCSKKINLGSKLLFVFASVKYFWTVIFGESSPTF